MRTTLALLALALSCAGQAGFAAEPAIHKPTVQAPVPPVVPPVAPGAPAAAVEANAKAAPAVTIPAGMAKKGKLTPAQQARVEARVPVVKKSIADLSADEQRAVLRKAAPPRQTVTNAERDARAKATRDAWAAKTEQDRAGLRARYLAAWQKLSPADRAYRRERMQEQLRALPEADRKAVIAPFVLSNQPGSSNQSGQPANAAPR